MRIRNRPLHSSLPANASPPHKPAVGRPELALGGAAMAAVGGQEENLGAYLTQIGLVRRRRRRAAGGSSPQPTAGSMGSGVVDQGAAAGQEEDWEDGGSRLSVEEETGISRTGKVEEPLVKKRKQSEEDDEELLASMWSKTKMKQRKSDAGKERPQEKNEDFTIEKKHKSRMCKASSKSSNQSKVELVIEGSRCSRINGRGWRCSQQTLVGYSLCEHHLGKGRLKSMSSLPGRHSARKNMNNTLSSDNINEQDQTLMEAKKSILQARKSCTIGLVKARTVSSLLNVVAGHDHSSTRLSIDASACEDGSIGTVPGDDQLKNKVEVS